MEIALFQPQIPQNTGNTVRQCAAMEAMLHIIKPTGFQITDRYLKRAGLDYWDDIQKLIHEDFASFLQYLLNRHSPFPQSERSGKSLKDYSILPVYPVSTMGYHNILMHPIPQKAILLFGSEDTGLPPELLSLWAEQSLYIPQPGSVRSMNLANSVAIALFTVYAQMISDKL